MTDIACLPEPLCQRVCSALDMRTLLTLCRVSRDMKQAAQTFLACGVTELRLLRQTDVPGPASGDISHHALFVPAQNGVACLRSLLPRLTSLVNLDLSRAFQWVGPAALSVIGSQAPASLRCLTLRHCQYMGAEGMEALCSGGALTHLHTLTLDGCGSVGTGAPLARLTGLRTLHADWCASLTSEGVVDVCRQLHVASFKGCDSLDDTVCAAFQCVQEVDLSYTRVTDEGLFTLAKLSTLRVLKLAAQVNNIYVSGLYTDVCLAMLSRRQGLTVKVS